MKRLVGFVLTLAIYACPGAPASAQDATPIVRNAPVMTAAALGLTELQVEITDSGFVASGSIPAGRILVTVTNTSQQSESSPAFLRMEEGDTVEGLNAHIAAVQDFFEGDGSTPPAEDPFAFLYDATLAGGTNAIPGEVSQVIVDLAPGDWAIIDANFQADVVVVSAEGELPAELPAIDASASITAVDDGEVFDFAIDGTIASGPQIVAIVNESSQVHFTEFDYAPPGYVLTEEMMGHFMMLDSSEATPDPAWNLVPFEVISFPFFANLQSSGTTQWLIGDFAPGSYAVTCFVPDPRYGGTPHSVMGMYEVFQVA